MRSSLMEVGNASFIALRVPTRERNQDQSLGEIIAPARTRDFHANFHTKQQKPPPPVKALQEGPEHSWDGRVIEQAFGLYLRSEHAKEG
jgi:hypothetical protein